MKIESAFAANMAVSTGKIIAREMAITLTEAQSRQGSLLNRAMLPLFK